MSKKQSNLSLGCQYQEYDSDEHSPSKDSTVVLEKPLARWISQSNSSKKVKRRRAAKVWKDLKSEECINGTLNLRDEALTMRQFLDLMHYAHNDTALQYS